MVAKCLDDNKPIKSLKSLFAPLKTSFNLANLGEIFFGTVYIYRHLSLEIESDNFCVVFTYSIKRAREIRKFHVVVM